MYGVKIKFKFYTQLFQEQLRMQFKREKCKRTLSINATPKNIHTRWKMKFRSLQSVLKCG